jgi:hypothetical protein
VWPARLPFSGTLRVGYAVIAHHNDSRMYLGGPSVPRCLACGCVEAVDYVNPAFRLVRPELDWSTTHDGCALVSARVKAFFEERGVPGAAFLPLPSSPRHYRLSSRRVLPVDLGRQRTCFGDYCARCSRHRVVAGSHLVVLMGVTRPLPAGLYRTDVEFGEGDGKAPCFILAPETYRLAAVERWRGAVFQPVRT